MQNPKNRFESQEVVWDDGEAPLAVLHVHEEHAKSILSENQSPDVPFRFSVNPYRGCQHACAYCYARPSHAYWGFGAGTDFEREIIVKKNAPDLLRAAFAKKSWQGDRIAFSGNTDCYQPLEGRYRLTRALLSICAEHKNPVGVITKSALVVNDIDVLSELARVTETVVFVSIPFADDALGRAIEPGAAPIHRRFETLEKLSSAGILTGVAIAPIIAGLNDGNIPEILERAKAAGASRAFKIALRLPAEVLPVFTERLQQALPELAERSRQALPTAERVLSAIRQTRGGKLNEAAFGARMEGKGPRWQLAEDLFELHAKRLGFQTERDASSAEPTFERSGRQLALFR